MKVTIQFKEGVEDKAHQCLILDGVDEITTPYNTSQNILEILWGKDCKCYTKTHRHAKETEEIDTSDSRGVWRTLCSNIEYIKIEK